MEKHVNWLKSIGMVVNVGKTEAVIFSKNEPRFTTLTVNNESFSTSSSMKVLGVTFDSKLKWDVHVNNVVKSAKKSIQGLRILRRNLSEYNFMKVLTAQLFSKMYYGSSVWLNHLSSIDFKRVESIHYTALRIACHDYKCSVSRGVLDHDYRRATPKEWMNYGVAREFIRIYQIGTPVGLFERLDKQSYRTSRPQLVKFYDTSRTRIGLQIFSNKVAIVSKNVEFDWFFSKLSQDALRIKLKNSLFKYPSSAASVSIPERMNRQLRNYRKSRTKPNALEDGRKSLMQF